MEKLEYLPDEPGSYALHLVLREPVELVIGRLGKFCFPAGDYLYLGSAHGPGGLRARLRHHARETTSPHWHLDWLRPHGILAEVWFSIDKDGAACALECAWSQALLGLSGVVVPAPGFGSADCHRGCASHLIAFTDNMDLFLLKEKLCLPGVRIEKMSA